MPIDPVPFEGWFAPTDYSWFRFLRSRPEVAEVNFWSPSPRLPFRRLLPGTPFFFKLKSPYNGIGGFGYFAHGSSLPLRLAWDAFGEKNGADSLDSLVGSIAEYNVELKHSRSPAAREIGCLMVSQPVFFDDDAFIPQPADWPAQAVRGKTISLVHGEGLRIWRRCQMSAAARRSGELSLEPSGPSATDRYGNPVLVRPRLGQGTFRVAVLDAYERHCVVSGEHSLPVLDAAHIRPYAQEGRHELPNGLVLRADIHRLFDLGYVGIDPQGRFRVSDRLRQDWDNGRVYYDMRDRQVRRPTHSEFAPDPKVLEWHMDEVFLG